MQTRKFIERAARWVPTRYMRVVEMTNPQFPTEIEAPFFVEYRALEGRPWVRMVSKRSLAEALKSMHAACDEIHDRVGERNPNFAPVQRRVAA